MHGNKQVCFNIFFYVFWCLNLSYISVDRVLGPLFPLILDISCLVPLKYMPSFPYSPKPIKGKQQFEVLKLRFFKGGNLMIE